MKLKDFIRETARQVVLGDKASSQAYVRHLEKIGVTLGTDVMVYAPNKTMIDEQYPWMIRIGNHVRIAEGVKILTHDFSWSVIKGAANREMRGAILGCCKPVDIGNNVFIGVNAVLLGGTHIGDDVVIGAGSVVTGDIPSGVVAAGVPARVKCTLEEYYRKRREQQMEEAAAMARGYKEKFGVIPPPDVFHEFFMLFSDEKVLNEQVFIDKMKLGGNMEDSIRFLRSEDRPFSSYDDFIRYCFPTQQEKVDP